MRLALDGLERRGTILFSDDLENFNNVLNVYGSNDSIDLGGGVEKS